MIFLEPPENFNPQFEIAVLFCEVRDEMLLILRQPWESEGGTWCLPGGMINTGERPLQAVMREIKEECGLELSEDQIAALGKVYVRKPQYDYAMNKFYVNFAQKPRVNVNADEHQDFCWVRPEQGLNMNLIPGGPQTLQMFLDWKQHG